MEGELILNQQNQNNKILINQHLLFLEELAIIMEIKMEVITEIIIKTNML